MWGWGGVGVILFFRGLCFLGCLVLRFKVGDFVEFLKFFEFKEMLGDNVLFFNNIEIF